MRCKLVGNSWRLLAISWFIGTSFVAMPGRSVAFLDVDQGDAILIQNRTAQILVDGGSGTVVLRRLMEEMPWFDQKIEVIIATHPDRDHLEGLVHVLEKYEVGMVLLPNQAHDSGLQKEWLDRLLAKEILFRFAEMGQTIEVDGLRLEILAPEAGRLQGDNNDNSIVAKLDFEGVEWLLTGDATVKTEKKLLQKYEEYLDVDVLKIGHHGSKSSTSEAFIQATSPSVAVISVGENSYGHPTKEVLDRLREIKILRTDQSGTVRWRWMNNQWWLYESE
jgi:competence protein ComEC